ncbi:MAG TPA: helix-turn-helix domain-containing protein [Anaerolineales bacterium]
MKNTDPPQDEHRNGKVGVELNRFIEGMGIYFENEGVPRIGGRILGLMLASHGPLSAGQLAERLKVSRASISTNIRMLTASGLVDKVAFLDQRHTYYSVAGDVWGKAISAGREKVRAFQSIAEMGLEALPDNHVARRRLEEMIDWSKMMAEVYERVLVEWQQRQSAGMLAERKAG